MSRSGRIKSITGIYHIMLRGMDKRDIFMDDMDRLIFTKIIERVKRQSGFKLYAYCLMDNHVHMLIREDDEPIELIFKRIGVSYSAYFNRKYDRCGHLYQDRFKSEPVETIEYFMDALRYICQNPIKAGLCDRIKAYPWLECDCVRDKSGMIDDISEYTSLSGANLLSFVNSRCEMPHLEEAVNKRMTDQEAAALIFTITRCRNPQDLRCLESKVRNLSLKTCLNSGVSVRQLARITGLSKSTIERIKKDK